MLVLLVISVACWFLAVTKSNLHRRRYGFVFYFVIIYKPFDDLAVYLCIVRSNLADCAFLSPSGESCVSFLVLLWRLK